ncbi:type II toxin-antitoxin system PrlF family antitoxin [Novosphingobium subterraneum]|nr:type II toxin-antitoxin system PrlF family antitoxin [Novosphingobium subterraneum]
MTIFLEEISSFLSFLAADLKRHPEAVKALGPELAARITSLTANVPVDVDEAIGGDVDL